MVIDSANKWGARCGAQFKLRLEQGNKTMKTLLNIAINSILFLFGAACLIATKDNIFNYLNQGWDGYLTNSALLGCTFLVTVGLYYGKNKLFAKWGKQ